MQVRKSILILVIIGACLCSYFNTLFADFVWDDDLFITQNPYMKSFRFLPKFFTHNFWKIGPYANVSNYYRPLLAASFMLDYAIWKSNPLGFHLTNILFHILASILVFFFVELLIRNRFTSFVSALLFSVHPIHTEVVSFVSGRVDSIPLVFFLLSLILFLKYFYSQRLIFYLLSLLCFFTSLLGKEIAATLPLIVICIDYLFLSQRNLKNVIKNFLRFHMSFFIILALYLLIHFYFVPWKNFSMVGVNFPSGTTPLWRLFTFIKIISLYLRLLFSPYDLKVVHLFPPSNSIFEPVVLIGLVISALFIFTAIKNVKNNPILSFSILWFFITLLPVSNLFPQGNIFAERYMYLPSVGYCMAIGFFFSWLLKKEIKTDYFSWRSLIHIVFFILITASGRVTYERNKVWENGFTLWYYTVKATPHSPLAHVNLAYAYGKRNRLDKALAEAKIAIKLDPDHVRSIYTLGYIYFKKGLFDEAIKELKRVTTMTTQYALAYQALAIVYGKKGQYKESIEAGLMALEKNPYMDEARYNLALSYKEDGLINEAINAYEEYLKTNPNYANVHLDVGQLYYEKGDYQKAREHWLTVLKINKDYRPAKEALKLLAK